MQLHVNIIHMGKKDNLTPRFKNLSYPTLGIKKSFHMSKQNIEKRQGAKRESFMENQLQDNVD